MSSSSTVTAASASSSSSSSSSSVPASTSSSSSSSPAPSSSSSSYSPWSRTILGPLTTTFTAPPSCSIVIAGGYDASWGNFGQSCSGTDYSGDTACWPSTSFGLPLPSSDGLEFHGWGFYSPGWVCPAGHTSACSATGGGSTDASWPGQFPLIQGETAVGCCPTGYGCGLNTDNDPNNVQLCTKTATSTDTFSIGFCPSGTLVGTSIFTMSSSETWSGSSSASFSTFELAGPLIDIRWRSEDRPASTSKPTHKPNPSPGGLSTGAKIATGVVVPVVVLALLAGLMAFFYRRRKKRRTAWQTQQNPPQPTWYQPDKSEGHMVARYASNDYQEPSELVGTSAAKHRTGEPGDVIEATPLHEVEDTSPRIGVDKRG